MGASQSSPDFPVRGSVVWAPAEGDSGEIRRNPKFKDALVPSAFPEVRTLYDAFQRGLRISGDANCMGYRPISVATGPDGKPTTVAGDFVWTSYKAVQAKIDAVGSALHHLDMIPKNDTGHRLVGLFSKNRWEWAVAEQACHAYDAADVPLYDTLGAEAIAFIVSQTCMATVFSDRSGVPKLIAAKNADPAATTHLKHVVQFEDTTDAERKAAAAAGLTLRTMAEIIEVGTANKKPHMPPKPEELGFICYTSGTTGMPKGAMISHANMIADASAAFTADLGLCATDVHLSYLPLAHSFERLVHCAMWMAGGAIGYFQGDTLKLMDDIKALRPTIFPSVPRLYNRIYDKVMGGVEESGGVKAALFKKAFAAKRQLLKTENKLNHGLWDKLVFSKVAGRVGLDRVRIMLTGSAPIAPHVIEFLRVVFRAHVCEGYGQTENSAAATLTSVYDQASLGHVGGPLANNEVKLVSVPDMGYLVSDKVHGREVDEAGKVVNPGIPCSGRGEVCLRGHNIMMGYYKDAEKTAEALDQDGWLHTGDVGLWDENGNLRIVDRKKNIFKLSQGEYVAAEKVENVYIKATLVQQSFVYGDSLHSMLVAIVVPDPDALRRWAKKSAPDAADASVADLCKRPDVKKAVLDEMTAIGKESKLQGFEQAKDILLEPNAWTPEDILTPSFKLKRTDAKKKYLAAIDDMYSRLESVAGMKGLKQGAVLPASAAK